MKPIGDIESWLALGLIDGLGDESMRRLLVAFGSPAGILSAKAASLERLVKKKVVDSIIQGTDRKKIKCGGISLGACIATGRLL